MTGIFLCAGYATRLYPLTLKQAKPLLPVAGRPILEYSLARVRWAVVGMPRVVIVTNDLFHAQFEVWRRTRKFPFQVEIVNDGTRSNDERLGAIRDMQLALEKVSAGEDVVVLAGDNIFDFDLKPFFLGAARRDRAATVGVYDVEDRSLATRYGIVELGPGGRIVKFSEKPAEPKTTLASMGLYYFPRACLADLGGYLAEGGRPDAPGYFVDWLSQKREVYAHVFRGIWFDIGDAASYEKANEVFSAWERP